MRLKELRIQSQFKLSKILNLLEVSRSTYYKIELGKRKLKKIEAEKLAELFNVDINEIYGRDTNERVSRNGNRAS